MQVNTLVSNKGENLLGPILITPDVFEDDRGFFYESWNQNAFREILNSTNKVNLKDEEMIFVQDNHSLSKKGVLRGIHYQVEPYSQGKLVRCIRGEIFDVIIDLRKNLTSFGTWAGVYLNSQSKRQLWVPRSFGHAFLTMSSEAEVNYKTTNYWDRESEKSIRWNDPDLSIIWPEIENKVYLSEKDESAPLLKEISHKQLF